AFRARLLGPAHLDLDRVRRRQLGRQTTPVLVQHAPQVLELKVVLEGEPLLAAARGLAAALPFEVEGAHHAGRRRGLDLERVEVLLEPAHVVESDLAGGNRREVAPQRDSAANPEQQEARSHPDDRSHARHSASADYRLTCLSAKTRRPTSVKT